MKITKFPQSCVLIESKGTKILIDPGEVLFQEKFMRIWKTVDVVLVSHKHSDHFSEEILKKLGKPVYTTHEVEKECKSLKVNVIREKDVLNFGEIKIDVDNISKKCDAVLITHYHCDHIGEYMQVRPDIPIYIGEQAKDIFTIFQNKMKDTGVTEITQEYVDRIETFKTFKQGVPFEIGDMKITPIRTDHSAFDSYMFLIEADGKRILHTGDFRTHGHIGNEIPKILETIGNYLSQLFK